MWYTGSAVDQMFHEHGVVFARMRERGRRGGEDSFAWFEWAGEVVDSEGEPIPLAEIEPARLEEADLWSAANPGMGIRIAEEHVAKEFRSMDDRQFAVERLGIGDWPSTIPVDGDVIRLADWVALRDERSKLAGSVCFAFDVKPDRSFASIAVAGVRGDGIRHGELVDRRGGTDWVVKRIADLLDRHEWLGAVVCDPYGSAGSLIPDLEELGIEVRLVTAREHARLRQPLRPRRTVSASSRRREVRPIADASPPWAAAPVGGGEGSGEAAARRRLGVESEGKRRHFASRRGDARALGSCHARSAEESAVHRGEFRMSTDRGGRHATAMGGVAVLDRHAALMVAYIIRQAQLAFQVDSMDELLERLMFGPEQSAAARDAQAALHAAASPFRGFPPGNGGGARSGSLGVAMHSALHVRTRRREAARRNSTPYSTARGGGKVAMRSGAQVACNFRSRRVVARLGQCSGLTPEPGGF